MNRDSLSRDISNVLKDTSKTSKRNFKFRHTLAAASLGLFFSSGCSADLSAAVHHSNPVNSPKTENVSSKKKTAPKTEIVISKEKLTSGTNAEAKTEPASTTVSTQQPDTKNNKTDEITNGPSFDIKNIRVAVIMYHRFVENVSQIKYPDLEVTGDEFRQGLINLKNSGYSTISLEQLYDFMVNGKAIPEKSFVLTFDDGWEEPKEVTDTLKELGDTANVAIITNYPRETKKNGSYNPWTYLSWEEINNLMKQGVIIPENHTVDHPNLLKLDAGNQQHEIEDADKSILAHTGQKPQALVLPYGYGARDERIIDEAKADGYKMVVTVSNGLVKYGDNPMNIPRYSAVHGLDLAQQVKSIVEKQK